MARRFPQLHQRGETFYCFVSDENGKRHEKSLHTKDINDAAEKYDQLVREVRSGIEPNDLTGTTLGQAIEFYIDHRRNLVAPGTHNSERSIVKHFSKVWENGAKLQSLANIGHIWKYQQARLKAGATPKTINNELQVFMGLLRLAQLWQRVEHQYKPLRVKKSDIPDALTQEESVRLLQVAAKSSPTAVAPFVAALALLPCRFSSQLASDSPSESRWRSRAGQSQDWQKPTLPMRAGIVAFQCNSCVAKSGSSGRSSSEYSVGKETPSPPLNLSDEETARFAYLQWVRSRNSKQADQPLLDTIR